MTDDRNDTDGQSPPPLVPPPARLNDLPYREQDGDESARPSADSPVFLEPGADIPDVDARDLGHDPSSADDGSAGSTASDDSAAGTGTVSDGTVSDGADTGRSSDDADTGRSSDDADTGRSSDDAAAGGPASDDSSGGDRVVATSVSGPDDTGVATDRASDDAAVGRPADPAYEERPLDEPGRTPEPVASVDGREQTTDFPTAEPPAAAVPVAPAADPYSSAAYAPTTAYAPAPAQREFVEPPVEPKKKGNRGVGALIALLSVILFAVIYAAIAVAIRTAQGPQDIGETLLAFVQNPVFYIPAIIFVVAFVIVVLLANRASWWAYVLGSLLVGALVYFGTIGAGLVVANIYTLTPTAARALVFETAINPYVIAAALVAREVSLWTGAAISARGRRVKAKNTVAREDYDRAAAEHRAEFERPYPLA